jgi:endonuclease/exonuclease/phosphatase family metal-dependent hydrolase
VPVDPGPRRLTLATYNVHRCVGGDGHRDPHRIAGVLRELDADVVALQEVESRTTDAADLLAELVPEGDMAIVPGPTLHRADASYGNALLTRLPVRETRRLDLSVPGREPRGALRVTMDWAGRELRVAATHLGLAPGERRIQVRSILSEFAAEPAGVEVLMGDLNEWFLWGRPLRWLRRRFAPAPAVRSYPARHPLFALDRIWVRPGAALRTIARHETTLARVASDHLPVKAVIEGWPPLDAPD